MSRWQRMAHDLKTPLSVITGYAELLRTRDDERTRREAPVRILEAAERLSAELERLFALLGREVYAAELGNERTRRILLVDDDPTLRGLLRATLPSEGYEIVEAGNTRAAIAAVEEDVDLVVLDWRLPDGDGGNVLERVKAIRPQLPVIVLTGETTAEAEAADAFVQKPFSPVELLDLVDRLLSDRAPG